MKAFRRIPVSLKMVLIAATCAAAMVFYWTHQNWVPKLSTSKLLLMYIRLKLCILIDITASFLEDALYANSSSGN